MPTPSSSSTVHRPLGPAALFILLLVVAALAIVGLMRAVTPVKERMNGTLISPIATTTKPGSPVFDEVDGKPGNEEEEPAVQPTPTTPTTTTSTTTVNTVRPRPTGAVCDAQNFICVTAPAAQTTIGNPVLVQGTAIAFENTVQYELQDAQGFVMANGFVTANAPDVGQPGPFETRIFWNQLPTTSTGTLVMFEASARDGQPIHTVRVPVRFTASSAVSRFISLVSENVTPSTPTGCDVVYQQKILVPSTTLPVEATLRALLRLDPVNIHKLYPGYTTAIPAGTSVVSLKVANGVATVVLSRQLEAYGGGSCNVMAIRTQIESTLKQFPSIRSVVISVEGKTPEESLQP